jgi:hypothetical protein
LFAHLGTQGFDGDGFSCNLSKVTVQERGNKKPINNAIIAWLRNCMGTLPPENIECTEIFITLTPKWRQCSLFLKT